MTRSEGAVIGPYHLVRSLGQGGAGEVWLAAGSPSATASAGDVAIKILTGPASDPAARGIAQQAQAAGSLQQPHILPFYGVVEQENLLAVAMAYARGGSLGDMLRTAHGGGSPRLTLPLPPGVVARLVVQLARTLADAHAAGLVHGDVKPSNIFVRTSPSGQPLAALGDFGQALLAPAAATLAARAQSASASAGRPLGADSWAAQQLRFAAPEQLGGQSLPASDQYALAALAYLLLTGVPPFAGDAPTLAAAVASQRPAPPSAVNPAIPPDADGIILRALEKDPAARYPTIVGFAGAFEEALADASASGVTRQFARLADDSSGNGSRDITVGADDGSVRLTLRGSAAASARARSTRRGDRLSTPGDTPRSLRRPLTIIAIAALCLIVVATIVAFRAVDNAAGLPNIVHHGKPTLSASATPQTNPTVTASGHDAERQLAAVTGRKPLFSDALRSNAQHWPTSGSVAYFGVGGFHIHDTDSKNIVAVHAPFSGATGTQDVVVQSVMTFTQSSPGNFAGLLFYVSDDTSTYYSFTISDDGRYTVWLRDAGGWTYVTGGYSTAISTSLSAPNTLAVLARGSTGDAYFFVNGHYVVGVRLSASGPTSGGAGMIVLDNPTEVIYANFAVYDATQ